MKEKIDGKDRDLLIMLIYNNILLHKYSSSLRQLLFFIYVHIYSLYW
jgi:hypothetical protein